MRHGLLLVALACTGCDLIFTVSPADGGGPGDDDVPADASRDGAIDGGFAHLPATLTNTNQELRIEQPTTIDTSTLTITPAPVGDPQISGVDQPGGAQLMVIAAGNVTLSSQISVIGLRALVIVGAQITVTQDAVIDGGADFETNGPGARMTGAGVGSDGQVSLGSVSGAGGGAFDRGSKPGGAAGGTACLGIIFGGDGGDEIGDAALTLLHGGSRGGGNAQCGTTGGGGGGAIQLSATESIAIAGTIDVGGGGGSGGNVCTGTADGGGGGGAGGAIYLEAPTIDLASTSVIAANGGGGGGGGCDNPVAIGNFGTNGRLTATSALGGVEVAGGCGDAGGGGAFLEIIAAAGNTVGCDEQAGGGGGATGRIVVRALTVNITGIATPTPTQISP